MRIQTSKRILVSIVGLMLVLGLIGFARHRPGLSVTILNPKCRLLTAELSHGRSHKLYHNGPLAGPALELIHRAGCKFGDPPLLARTTNSTYALVARYSGDFKPNELYAVQAELADGAGSVTRLPHAAGYTSGKTPNEYGKIWLLESPLTDAITVRLRPLGGKVPLAEIRVEAR